MSEEQLRNPGPCLDELGDPLLGSVVEGPAGWLFLGRVSLAEQPWLAGHAVAGTVLVPGTAIVVVALRAGERIGRAHLDELTLQVPMVLREGEVRDLRVVLGHPGDDGACPVTVHSRVDGAASADLEWVRHATGVLSVPSSGGRNCAWASAWPPEGAEPVGIDDVYERLASAGYEYGSAFRGMRAVWRRGGEVYGEITLPDEPGAGSFVIHPALLDAALHPSLVGSTATEDVLLPFSWREVAVHVAGATSLRVRLTIGNELSLEAAAPDGALVAEVGSLVARPVDPARLEVTKPSSPEHFTVDRVPLATTGSAGSCGVVGEDRTGIARQLLDAGVPVAALHAADVAVFVSSGDGEPASRTEQALEVLKSWSTESRGRPLVIVTRGAVVARPGEVITDVAGGALRGLVRSAANEHPGRLVSVDLDGRPESLRVLASAVASGEPEIAIRAGEASVPRLVRARPGLPVPAEGAWHVDVSGRGTVENLVVVPAPQAERELAPGEVRVAIRAAGVNFRDALNVLGMYPGDPGPPGNEGAGVVLEVGPGVTEFTVGDRVFGILPAAYGSGAVTDARLVARMPETWSFADGASVSMVFLTAYYGLRDLAGVRAGESVLIHAAAGGVGMAAVQLARLWGCDVYATASPPKKSAVTDLGVAPDRIASSRDTGFASAFPPVDVVLNSLSGEFVDASLGLLRPGGRFIEMGKTDVRQVTAVRYRAFDLSEAGPDRVREILCELLGLFDQGALRLPPVTSWDVRQAGEALRFVAQARHIGKVVLTVPGAIAGGTVLITGGTAEPGVAVARQLAERGVTEVVLVDSGGAAAPDTLQDELTARGLRVRIVAADLADRETAAAVLSEHRPDAIVHAAGAWDDGAPDASASGQPASLFRTRVETAVVLDELSRDLDLAAFVVLSSDSAITGGPDRGRHSAADTFLDALVQRRRALGLPGLALASPAGSAAALLDAAWDSGHAYLATGDFAARVAEGIAVPPLLRDLARASRRPDTGGPILDQDFAGLDDQERQDVMVDLVRGHAATVLGRGSLETIEPDRAFRDFGFDSLTAVEFRNRLGAATGLKLPATVVFDYPSSEALARHLLRLLGPAEVASPGDLMDSLRRLESELSVLPDGDPVWEQARKTAKSILARAGAESGEPGEVPSMLDDASDEEMFRFIASEFRPDL
ncbi:KR domain-containing protein [Amycolatopsis sp. NPDC058278]|uniref:KR domain-containing protein n=1 Tax=Amycolatopsis sp. NPDC058278 TaxID=3346417 RepID=UPI0036DD721C